MRAMSVAQLTPTEAGSNLGSAMSVNKMRCFLSLRCNISISRRHNGHAPSKKTSTAKGGRVPLTPMPQRYGVRSGRQQVRQPRNAIELDTAREMLAERRAGVRAFQRAQGVAKRRGQGKAEC